MEFYEEGNEEEDPVGDEVQSCEIDYYSRHFTPVGSDREESKTP